MTFTELQTAVKDLCNLSSTDANTRIGKAINRHYKRITASLGLNPLRFVTRAGTASIGVQTVTFTSIEAIDRVIDATDANAIRKLDPVSIDTIRTSQPGTGDPCRFAIESFTASSVTILLDTVPQSTYSLQADGRATVSDLSGTDVPVIAESYHDILTFLVVSEELLKKEKRDLAGDYATRAEDLLKQYRFEIADAPPAELQQGGNLSPLIAGSAAGGTGNEGGDSYTQTGLITFDRDPSAPFAVTASSAKVTNLDADKLDGLDSTAFSLAFSDSAGLRALLSDETGTGSAVFANAPTFAGAPTLPNTALKIQDTDASHTLTIVEGSNLTGNRTLTITPGDVSRILTLTGDATLADWFDQAVKAASSPTFAAVTLGNIGLKVLDTDASHALSIVPGSNITAARTLTLTTGDASRTITLSGNPTLDDWFDQAVKVASTPTFGATTITGPVTISGASAGQIVFPATQNSSAGANVLDDYEEGSWTPVIGGSGGTSGQTYTTQVGHYVKIGSFVMLTCEVTLSVKGTITGNVQIQGFPFSVHGSGPNAAVGLGWSSLATTWVSVVAVPAAGSALASVVGATVAAASNLTSLTTTDIAATTNLRASICYRATA